MSVKQKKTCVTNSALVRADSPKGMREGNQCIRSENLTWASAMFESIRVYLCTCLLCITLKSYIKRHVSWGKSCSLCLNSSEVQRHGEGGSVALKLGLIYSWQKSKEEISMGRKRKWRNSFGDFITSSVYLEGTQQCKKVKTPRLMSGIDPPDG